LFNVHVLVQSITYISKCLHSWYLVHLGIRTRWSVTYQN